MLIDEGLELLDEDEARRLLRQEDLGRVGVTMGALPAIFPVNYVVLDGDVFFRTSPGSKLSAAAANAIVAFEVDQHDRADRTGWSVLVVGRAEIVDDPVLLALAGSEGLAPYARGQRANLVRVHTEMISGRRVLRDRDLLPTQP